MRGEKEPPNSGIKIRVNSHWFSLLFGVEENSLLKSKPCFLFALFYFSGKFINCLYSCAVFLTFVLRIAHAVTVDALDGCVLKRHMIPFSRLGSANLHPLPNTSVSASRLTLEHRIINLKGLKEGVGVSSVENRLPFLIEENSSQV